MLEINGICITVEQDEFFISRLRWGIRIQRETYITNLNIQNNGSNIVRYTLHV